MAGSKGVGTAYATISLLLIYSLKCLWVIFEIEMELLQHVWLAQEADGLAQAASRKPCSSLAHRLSSCPIYRHDLRYFGYRSLAREILPVSIGLDFTGGVRWGWCSTNGRQKKKGGQLALKPRILFSTVKTSALPASPRHACGLLY